MAFLQTKYNEALNQWTDIENRQEGIDMRGKSEEESKGHLFLINKRVESIRRLFVESI